MQRLFAPTVLNNHAWLVSSQPRPRSQTPTATDPPPASQACGTYTLRLLTTNAASIKLVGSMTASLHVPPNPALLYVAPAQSPHICRVAEPPRGAQSASARSARRGAARWEQREEARRSNSR